MKDRDQKFTVISNKKVIKRFTAVIDSNDSNFNEQTKEAKPRTTCIGGTIDARTENF